MHVSGDPEARWVAVDVGGVFTGGAIDLETPVTLAELGPDVAVPEGEASELALLDGLWMTVQRDALLLPFGHSEYVPIESDATVSVETLDAALAQILALDTIYKRSGSVHGCALLRNLEGAPLLYHVEDVGRHNAVDKVVGAALRADLDLTGHGLLVSSRAGFEIVQKAVVAGLGAVYAVGAATSLAVDLAAERGLPLVGFLRADRFTRYDTARARPATS